MTHSETHPAHLGHRCSKAGSTEFLLPLVSVIIVNYNYGRFLTDAVESVFNQKYKRIECFLVDNKSTDDSRYIIEELSARYPDLDVTYRSSNEGQCVASAEAFPKTKGQYIVFLDADDVLLPDFVGTHVYAALSLYAHVGFTCSDMFQVVDDQLVLSTSHTIKELISETRGDTERMLRPLPPSVWSSEGLTPLTEGEVLLVSRKQQDWRWTATSAFMFRRDAISLLIDNPQLKTLRCALDVYFARGINVITGSALIDRPLCIYRMHGSNIFSRHAHLDYCLNFELGGKFDQSEVARRQLIDFWFAQARSMIKKLTVLDDFVDGIKTLNDAPPRLTEFPLPPHTEFPAGRRSHAVAHLRRSYAAAQLLKHFAVIREIVGLPTLLRWCLRLRLSPFAVMTAMGTRDKRRARDTSTLPTLRE